MKRKNDALPGRHWYSYVFLYGFLKPLLFLYFSLFQHVKFRSHGLKPPRGPVLFIGNHHTNWDGFYHAVMFYWRFPHYIVHDEAFKNRFFAGMTGSFLGQVKRSGDALDMEPVRQLKRLVASGQSVNVLPEGDIHMFGGTLAIDENIAKLAKLLGIPIVLTRVIGAHQRAPRWSNLAHHSRIIYEMSDIIAETDVKALPMAELHARIVKGISINAYDEEVKHPLRLWGARRAEWIELGLFLCPQCHSYETLTSRGNDFVCMACGQADHVDRRLRITGLDIKFDRPDHWNDWQLGELTKTIEQTPVSDLLFSLSGARFSSIPNGKYFNGHGRPASARLYGDRIEVEVAGAAALSIMMSDIVNCLYQYKDVFEWETKDMRFRLWRPMPKWSAYLWANCVKIIKRL